MAGTPLAAVGTRGDDVLLHHLRPHAEREEDVRRHVLRVIGAGRDDGVALRGIQADGRVDRIVEGVNDVVRRAGMLGLRRRTSCARAPARM
jgi:hypothetical protein